MDVTGCTTNKPRETIDQTCASSSRCSTHRAWMLTEVACGARSFGHVSTQFRCVESQTTTASCLYVSACALHSCFHRLHTCGTACCLHVHGTTATEDQSAPHKLRRRL